MVKIDYLQNGGDVYKYKNINSILIWGKHPKSPKFTIVIPTYKRLGFLKQSLHSAIDQENFDDYEIVISDNDAEGKTVEENLKFINELNSDKIIYYKNEKNIGIYGNTLRAAQLAHGRYVVLLNDDDLLHPRYLEIINAFIEKYDYKGIVGSQPYMFGRDDFVFPKIHKKIYAFGISKGEFFFGCSVTSPGLMFPKEIAEELYNAHEDLLMGDQIMQYKSLRKYGLTFINFPLAAYRIADNATQKDSVLTGIIINMCHFRQQTADESWKLKAFMKIFEKEYFYSYVDSSLNFWMKRGLRKNIFKELGLGNVKRWSLKMVFYADLVDRIHSWYIKKHDKIYDFVEVEI